MTDPFALALGAVGSALAGAFGHRLLLDYERNNSTICPTCYGPLCVDGLSLAWQTHMVHDGEDRGNCPKRAQGPENRTGSKDRTDRPGADTAPKPGDSSDGDSR